MTTKLFYAPGDPDYLKVVLLRDIFGVPVTSFETVEEFPEDYERTSTCSEQQLLLVLPTGDCIFSSNEICRFLCCECGQDKLCGDTPEEQALIDHWLGWEASELKGAVKSTMISGSLSHELLVCLGRLESHLTNCPQFMVGEALSLADVVTWAALYVLLSPEGSTPPALHKDFPLVCRWFINLAKQDSFNRAVSHSVNFQACRDYVLGKTETHCARSEARTKSSDCSNTICDPVEQIPSAEMEAAREAWSKGPQHVPQPRKREHPILPLPGERNILITSALPYVNNVPHLGNIIGCVLSADVFARYCRLRNYNILYICGTDEYGTATETKALEEGLTPQQICSKYHAIHCEIYQWFNIEFDYFGKTSTPQQTEICQDIFWKLHERGYISQDTVDQLQCQNCDRFLADRFVEGICPFCAYEDARGDQCDKCGRLINATELKSPRCKICSSQPQVKTSNHLFLDLSKLEPTVTKWFQESSSIGNWSSNSQTITSTWLRDGLKPRCISRDLKWGTPVPLEGYTDKVFYVWFDAPIGYLSITACYTEQWEQWWKNPKEVQLYQFMAKDNVPFHTVIFPCSLLGAEDNYTLLNNISSTEYLNYEEGKFSKSRGVGVFGSDAMKTGIPADMYRFYLLYVRPETQILLSVTRKQVTLFNAPGRSSASKVSVIMHGDPAVSRKKDSAFSWSDFTMKNNSELLNNLGNFINRALMFIKNNFDSCIPAPKPLDEDMEVVVKVTRELKDYIQCLERLRIRDGLKHILSISRLCNGYIQACKPWKLVKGNPEELTRAESLMALCANVVCLLSVMLQPYMPAVSQQIQEQLQAPPTCNVLTETFVPYILPGHKIGQPYPLFTKIEDGTSQDLKQRFAGMQKTSETLSAGMKASLNEQLEKQADLVRQLKASGDTPKEKMHAEVEALLAIKSKLGMVPQTHHKKGKVNK